jgi:glycosyltransferase involved in cell wall biosynthesis
MDISVVIPLYNKEPYIKRSIESVLQQLYLPKEIIVVDDGSTDGGADIIHQVNNPIISMVQQPNQGESAARNRGIEEAKYDFIAFLDADDEWLPEFLFTIKRLYKNFPGCGAYATSYLTIKPDKMISYPDISSLSPEPWMGIIPNFFSLFQEGMAFNSSSIVIPRKILNEIDGFPVNIKHTPDIDTWVRIAIKYPIAFSPKRMSIYHQEAENRTAPLHSPLIEYPVLKTIIREIEDGNIPQGELKREAVEYIAQKQISVAINSIMMGNKKLGSSFLKKSQHTKKYRKKWLFWRFWSLFPSFVPQKLMAIKKFFRGY